MESDVTSSDPEAVTEAPQDAPEAPEQAFEALAPDSAPEAAEEAPVPSEPLAVGTLPAWAVQPDPARLVGVGQSDETTAP